MWHFLWLGTNFMSFSATCRIFWYTSSFLASSRYFWLIFTPRSAPSFTTGRVFTATLASWQLLAGSSQDQKSTYRLNRPNYSTNNLKYCLMIGWLMIVGDWIWSQSISWAKTLEYTQLIFYWFPWIILYWFPRISKITLYSNTYRSLPWSLSPNYPLMTLITSLLAIRNPC